MWVFLILLLLLTFSVYRFLTANNKYWKKRGVPHPSISIFFGSLKNAIFLKKSLLELYAEIYNDYPHLSYVGIYKIRQPAILVRDVELVKDILIKHFNHFRDNDFHIDEKTDPMLGKSPFSLKGDRWKIVRNQVTPCFTTKKLKLMFPLMEQVGDNLVTYLNESLEARGKYGLEAWELAAKFTTDVVASCAFGLEGKSFEDPKAEFREIGKKFLTPSFILALTHVCVFLVPSLANILNVKFFPDEVADYFRNIVRETMKYRENNNIVKGDFLDLMKEFKSKLGDDEFSDEDIAAHASGFYADGFGTSSFALSFTLFEIAANPDVQMKLRDEIDSLLGKNGGRLMYDDLQKLGYLDNVISESLRKYPPGSILSKTCTKSYTLPSPLGEGKGPRVTIETGTPVTISIYGIQHDAKYYPDPERFNPDRFSEQNRDNLTKCTFLSFGEGPRACLGRRFAITQVKVAIAAIIYNFEVRLNDKTIVPLQIDPQYFLLKAKDDIFLNYYKRNK